MTVRAEAFSLDVEKDASFQPIADHSQDTPTHVGQEMKQGTRKNAEGKEGSNTTLIVGIATPVCLLGLLLFLFMGKRKRKDEEEKTAEKPQLTFAPAATEQTDFWKMAQNAVADSNQFAIVLPKAIIQRLEKHFSQEFLTREKALALLADKDAETAHNLREVIDSCDHFRYGFGGTELDTAALLERAKQLLGKV